MKVARGETEREREKEKNTYIKATGELVLNVNDTYKLYSKGNYTCST